MEDLVDFMLILNGYGRFITIPREMAEIAHEIQEKDPNQKSDHSLMARASKIYKERLAERESKKK